MVRPSVPSRRMTWYSGVIPADDRMVELDLALGVVLDVVALPEAGEVGALVQQLGDELVQVFGFRLGRGETAQGSV